MAAGTAKTGVKYFGIVLGLVLLGIFFAYFFNYPLVDRFSGLLALLAAFNVFWASGFVGVDARTCWWTFALLAAAISVVPLLQDTAHI